MVLVLSSQVCHLLVLASLLSIIAARQRITLDTAANSAVQHIWNTRALNFPHLLEFTPLTGTPAEYIASHETSYSALKAPVSILCVHLCVFRSSRASEPF